MLLRHAIYQAIRDAILTCEFRPGQELREQILAERYRVSRSPIRDSLLRLEQEKLVTVLPRQGYRVNPISVADAEDVFDLRLLIELACVATAAQAGEAALRGLDGFRGFSERDHPAEEFVEYDRSFHFAIANLSGNQRLATVARDLMEQVGRLGQITVRTRDQEEVLRECAEHEAIIDALQARDEDRASRLCREHLEAAARYDLASLRLITRR